MNDRQPEPLAVPRVAGFLADFAMGLRFYSRLPVPALAHEAPVLDRMTPALPFVSIAIGLGPALLLAILTLIGVPGIFAAGIATAALLVITGAMSEDGLADAADGLFGGSTALRRLEIMRDSRHGTYGVLALVLFVFMRVAAVGGIAAIHPIAAAALWLAAMVLARSGSIWLPLMLSPARVDGLSAAVGGVRRMSFVVGTTLAAVIAIVLAVPAAGIVGVLGALVLIALVAAGWAWLCQHLVGGQTGDLIGALQALLELAALTAFLTVL